MRVLVTGASGWIGSAAVADLLAAGHHVVGLARSDASAAAVTAAGAEALRGSLDDLDLLRRAASELDGVLHLAFKHDIAFSGGYLDAVEADRRVIEAFGEALEGSGRPLAIASGTPALPLGRPITEEDGHGADLDRLPEGIRGRMANAELALSLPGVRSSVLRFPPTVHGEGDPGFVATLVRIARDSGVSGYVGDGANRWPSVHRSDAARLCRLALEKAPAGSTLHATAEEGVPTRAIAEAIGTRLGLPAESVPHEKAADHFTWLAEFYGADIRVSSTRTRACWTGGPRARPSSTTSGEAATPPDSHGRPALSILGRGERRSSMIAPRPPGGRRAAVPPRTWPPRCTAASHAEPHRPRRRK